MKDDTDKHLLIGKIGNGGNQFITTVEKNWNSHFNELINFYVPFETRILRVNTGFYLQDHKIKSYKQPPCYTKRKIYRNFWWNCGWIVGVKINIKQSMVKLEDLILNNYDDCFLYFQEPLPVCIWEISQSHWLVNFPNISIRTKRREICVCCLIFPNESKQNKIKLDIEL